MKKPASSAAREKSGRSGRNQLLHRFERRLELPMLVLAFIWLSLVVIELVRGGSRLLNGLGIVIWIIFVADFAIKLALAPRRVAYVKKNWLIVISLLVPALRMFRIFQVLRLLGLSRAGGLLRIVSSLNRGMRALGSSLQRRGFGYVVLLTAMVTFGGAAGMYAFEGGVPGGLRTYGEALWWTAMIMTTMGSQVWPQTTEGRVLCFVLSLYALGVLGYVAATLATFFVGRDVAQDGSSVAEQLKSLHQELAALREDLQAREPSERIPARPRQSES